MSKGDSRRPSSVSKEEFDKNFEALFGKKKLNIWENPDEQEECNDEQVDRQETTPSFNPEAAGDSPPDHES